MGKTSVVKQQNQDIQCVSLIDTFFEESRWSYKDLGIIFAVIDGCMIRMQKQKNKINGKGKKISTITIEKTTFITA